MLEMFLTAYDPSDLPGGSVDPLGFERGYLALADEILPGLTNVASQPRYFGLLCAGLHLAPDVPTLNQRELVRHRKEVVMRTERFWALANVLARGEDASGGVRGVTYAADERKNILRDRPPRLASRFPLLSRQAQYGVIGMYGSVAEGMRFLNREAFALTGDLGEPIAEAFIEETEMPRSLRAAIERDGDVTETVLREWGTRAHVAAAPGKREAACVAEASQQNPVRRRMLRLLKRFPAKSEEDELSRLRRIVKDGRTRIEESDICEAILAILAYENCFRRAQLSLERLLWLCRNATGSAISNVHLAGDVVLARMREELPLEGRRFAKCMAVASLVNACSKLSDVCAFIASTIAVVVEPRAFVEAIIQRHADVQLGKFDRGRRKMPWLEWVDGNVVLSPTRVGGLNFEATEVSEISAHPYRLNAADALNRAAEAS